MHNFVVAIDAVETLFKYHDVIINMHYSLFVEQPDVYGRDQCLDQARCPEQASLRYGIRGKSPQLRAVAGVFWNDSHDSLPMRHGG